MNSVLFIHMLVHHFNSAFLVKNCLEARNNKLITKMLKQMLQLNIRKFSCFHPFLYYDFFFLQLEIVTKAQRICVRGSVPSHSAFCSFNAENIPCELQHLSDFTGTSGTVLAKRARNRHLPGTWEAIFVDHIAVQTCLLSLGSCDSIHNTSSYSIPGEIQNESRKTLWEQLAHPKAHTCACIEERTGFHQLGIIIESCSCWAPFWSTYMVHHGLNTPCPQRSQRAAHHGMGLDWTVNTTAESL